MAFSFRTYALTICIVLSLAVSACSQQAPESAAATFPSVTMPDTEVRTLKSSNTGRKYDIYIRLPAGYTRNGKKTYPILYVLDGQWDFKLLDSIYGGLNYDKFVPEMIIVGITYSGANPDYEALRAKDYTPTPVAGLVGSGDGPKFLAFLKEELIPFVEADYRADGSRRTLMGSSFGGLFTLYAMFTETALFSGYVAASPAVSYAGGI
ncbi:MAG: alpha/beta hydrolase, partial [Anaerolineae bacterium]|nr:alpha/beta hydrolase [Anaerolineae bacterium]